MTKNMSSRCQCVFIRKIIAAFLFIISFAAAIISGQQNVNASFAPAGGEDAKKADAFLSQWENNDMPGCSVGAVKDGNLVYKRAFGLANLDYDVPNTTSTLFNLASVSKPFTAMSIALLAEQGKLSLDDEIQKHVPEIPKYDHPVTIRHLIHHSSGIREYQALVLFGGLGMDNVYSDKTILEMLGRQKNISFVPGSKYQYSNSNYHLLGIIVGRVSGKSLREFAQENIFKPLGMKNTLFFDNRFEVVKNRASGYMVGPGTNIRVRSSLFDLVGGGGVLTTIEDLYLWTQNYYEPKVGNKETIRMMTTPGTLNGSEKMTYAFGVWRQEYKGLPTIEHSGNMAGFRAKIFAFPEQKFTAIALCNNTAILPSVIVAKLADIYLEGQLKPVAPGPTSAAQSALPPTTAISPKDAEVYAGIYAHRESGKMLKLSVKDGKLVESAIFNKEVPVSAAAENRLIVAEGNGMAELMPIIGKSGAVVEIRIMTKSGKPDVFVPAKPPLDSPHQLSEYAGNYYGEELDADHKISLNGDKLSLQISESLILQLTPAYADVFTAAGGQINLLFKRDDKGKITGSIFNSGADGRDVKGVDFRRL